MQSLTQYSAVKTLARSDALDLLAVHAQLAGSNAIPRRCSLARMKEGWEACAAAHSWWSIDCCHSCVFIAHQRLALAVSDSWVKILYPRTLVVFHLG